MNKIVEEKNHHSFSNSSLMRVPVLAVWLSALPVPIFENKSNENELKLEKQKHEVYKEIKKAIDCDGKFTHSNILVLETNYIYACAIHYLVNNPTEP
jgi:hypothetical protein